MPKWFDENIEMFPIEVEEDDLRIKSLLSFFGDLRGKKVLDAGCGKKTCIIIIGSNYNRRFLLT
jgi:predicted RNA methylase